MGNTLARLHIVRIVPIAIGANKFPFYLFLKHMERSPGIFRYFNERLGIRPLTDFAQNLDQSVSCRRQTSLL